MRTRTVGTLRTTSNFVLRDEIFLCDTEYWSAWA